MPNLSPLMHKSEARGRFPPKSHGPSHPRFPIFNKAATADQKTIQKAKAPMRELAVKTRIVCPSNCLAEIESSAGQLLGIRTQNKLFVHRRQSQRRRFQIRHFAERMELARRRQAELPDRDCHWIRPLVDLLLVA